MVSEKGYDILLRKISRNIKRLRYGRGLTQEQMAEKGYNYRFYQKLESGNYSPSLKTLHKLSKTFKVKIDEFFI